MELASIFAIDIAAYAVMSNHYHVVLHINSEKALSWSELEVIEHWHCLFKGSLLSQRFFQGEALSKAERNALSDQIDEWRKRLMSISWFMRCANEPTAGRLTMRIKSQAVSGKVVLNLRHCWMKKHWPAAWFMLT